MAVRFFSTQYTPPNEAEGVREILRKNKIPFYETPPTHFGGPGQAIFLCNDEDYYRARSLVDAYQRELRKSLKVKPLRSASGNRTGLAWIKKHPQRALLGISLILFVIFFPLLVILGD